MDKKRERLDKIMAVCRERMQEEVSVLLGKAMTFAEPRTRILSKEDFFSELTGKSVLAHVQLEGELEGDGCLIVPIRDAIRIGGTLIMLPDSELETVMSEEEYSEELKDSYGEIANIICGSLTSTFEEQFPKSFRLVRMEQEVLLPAKVEAESDEPIPEGTYYQMSSAMTLEGAEMGTLQLLLPAAGFGLVPEPVSGEKEPAGDKEAVAPGSDEVAASNGESPGQDMADTGGRDGSDQAQAVERTETVKKNRPKDIKKQKERIDRLLESCLLKSGEDVGGLLGGTLEIKPTDNVVCTKGELLDQEGEKQVLARMNIRGDGEGEAYLLISLRDAVFLGGTMIMLPDSELEEVVRNEEFGEDAEDAYGEIANIIAGAYTVIFEEQYKKKYGFVKTGLESIVPVKIDPDSDDVLPNDIYYLNAGKMSFNGQELGRVRMVFPAELFELESLARPEPAEESVEVPVAGQPSESGQQAGRQAVVGQEQASSSAGKISTTTKDGAADILVFTDDDGEAESIAGLLVELGYTSRILHYRDPMQSALSEVVNLVFLVMREVNEQGFGMAIKLNGAGLQVPLVVCGPAWTRTTVLKAVKYGASDILITPAGRDDIEEKLEANLVKKAA